MSYDYLPSVIRGHSVDFVLRDEIGLPDPTAPQPLTMSSREIAELLGSRHDNVKRTIESLVVRAVFDGPQSEEVQIETSHGRRHLTHVYLLDKRSSLIVVAQLSPEFTARVVDRWQELEALGPSTSSRPLDVSPIG